MTSAVPGYLTVGPEGTTTWVHAEGLEKYCQFKKMQPAYSDMSTVPTVHPGCIVLHQAGEAPNNVASTLFGIPGLCGMAAQYYGDLRSVSPKHTAWPHFTFLVDNGYGPIRTVEVMPRQMCTVTEAWYSNQFDSDDKMRDEGVWRIDSVMKNGMVRFPRNHTLLPRGQTLTHPFSGMAGHREC